jgi:hypothetical protein
MENHVWWMKYQRSRAIHGAHLSWARDYDHGESFVSLFPFLSARPSFDFDRLFLLLILITAFEIRLSFMDGGTPDEMSRVFFSM